MDVEHVLRDHGAWILDRLGVPLYPEMGDTLPSELDPSWRVPPEVTLRDPAWHRYLLAGRWEPPTEAEKGASAALFPDPTAVEVDAYQIYGDRWWALTQDGRSYPVEAPPGRLVVSLPIPVLAQVLPILQEAMTLLERRAVWDYLSHQIRAGVLGLGPIEPPNFAPDPDDPDPGLDIEAGLRALRVPTDPATVVWSYLRLPWGDPEVRRAFAARRFRRVWGALAHTPRVGMSAYALTGQGPDPVDTLTRTEVGMDLLIPTSLANHLGWTGTVRAKQTLVHVPPDQVASYQEQARDLRARIEAGPLTGNRRVELGWVDVLLGMDDLAQAQAAPASPAPDPIDLGALPPPQRGATAGMRQRLHLDPALRGTQIPAVWFVPDGRVMVVLRPPNRDPRDPPLGYWITPHGDVLPAVGVTPDGDWIPVRLSEVPDAPPPPTRATREVIERLIVQPKGPRRTAEDGSWSEIIADCLTFLQRKPIDLDVGWGNPGILGCGSHGCAYVLEAKPGYILKITTDERDVLAQVQARRLPPGMLPTVPRAWAFPTTGVYGYIQERVRPLGTLRDLYGVMPIHRWFEWSMGEMSGEEAASQILSRVHGQPYLLTDLLGPEWQAPLAHAVAALRGLTEARDHLRAIGITTRDITPANFGLGPEDRLWIFDLGYSNPPSFDLPMLGEDIPMSDVHDWILRDPDSIQIQRFPDRQPCPALTQAAGGGGFLLAPLTPDQVHELVRVLARIHADARPWGEGIHLDARGVWPALHLLEESGIHVDAEPPVLRAAAGRLPAPAPCAGPTCRVR